MSVLELHDVVVDYHGRDGRVRAVAGASISVERGRIVGLVGESGCGKSTLARAAVGLVAASSGTVTFEGRPVSPLGRRARPAELVRLQLVFQNPYSSLNPRRTVGGQLADGSSGWGRRRAARARRLAGERDQALPARVLRRPAPADRDRARTRREPLRDRARRAARLARRVRAGPAREPARAPVARARRRAAADLARPRDRPARGRRRLGHVPRADGRDGADRCALGAARAPVQRGADRRGAARRRGGRPAAEPPGEVPDPARPPTGCRFHPRCPYAFDRCEVEEPQLVELVPARAAACWLQPPGRAAEPLPTNRVVLTPRDQEEEAL